MRTSDSMHVCEIDNLPGNSQVAVSHGVFIRPDFRGKAHGRFYAERRHKMLEDLGYDYALCTVNALNEAQLKSMVGWRCLDKFISAKTGNLVYLFGKHLNDSEPGIGDL